MEEHRVASHPLQFQLLFLGRSFLLRGFQPPLCRDVGRSLFVDADEIPAFQDTRLTCRPGATERIQHHAAGWGFRQPAQPAHQTQRLLGWVPDNVIALPWLLAVGVILDLADRVGIVTDGAIEPFFALGGLG